MRTCECLDQNCKKLLEGFHVNRKIHPDCRKKHNKMMNEVRRQKEHSLHKNKERARFLKHHLKHPFILDDIIMNAMLYKNMGYENYGLRAIYENLRWAYKKAGLKISMPNNFTPYYARLAMDKEPELEGFFITGRIDK